MYHVLACLLVLAIAALLARTHVRELFEESETIFVSIASYRDKDCVETLKHMFDRADKPQRVFAGVCEQNTAAPEEQCVPAKFEHHANVRRISIPNTEAAGPTYARYLCSTLFRDETYFCQIDSHTRFVKGWDTKAIEIFKKCKTPKAVLTHYPMPTDMLDKPSVETGVPVLCRSDFDSNGLLTLNANVMPPSQEPRPVPFVSGGFVFGPGSMVRDVPYDPDLQHLFQGEEILYSARLYTSGYDAFTPTENLVYHAYVRADEPHFWDDIQYAETQQKTHKKVQSLLRLPGADPPPANYKFDMGTTRSLADYFKYAGIDPATRASKSGDIFCAPQK